MKKIETLFNEKRRLLETFLECVSRYKNLLSPQSESSINATSDEKLDWVDALTSEREAYFRMLQLIDQRIAVEGYSDSKSTQTTIEQIFHLGEEIQLTDQSLFLYINNIGFEIRAQILKGLKEKEAIAKFKSQKLSSVGDGIDQKA